MKIGWSLVILKSWNYKEAKLRVFVDDSRFILSRESAKGVSLRSPQYIFR